MKPKIFLSYSHKDAAKKDEFASYLRILELTDKAELWTDRELEDGLAWDPAIKAALEAADIVVILVTINALTSNYISRVEMKRAYEKFQEKTTRVVCVIMDDCPWEGIKTGIKKSETEEYKLGDFQAIKPLGQAIYAASQHPLSTLMNEAYKRIEMVVAAVAKEKG